MIRAIQNLLGRSIEDPAGCGFLKPSEVESFLDGSLPAKRLAAFDDHKRGGCGDCKLLAADLEVFHGVVTRGLIESERTEFGRTEAILKAQLRQKLDQMDPKPESRFSWNYVLGTATAAMLLAVVAIPLMRTPPPPELQALVLPNGNPVTIATEPMYERPELRTGMSLGDLWQLALTAYAENDFQAAEQMLRRVVANKPDDSDARKYHGICLVQLQRFDEALEPLNAAQAMEIDDSGLRDPNIDYYIGMAQVGLGDLEAAMSSLDSASEASGAIGSAAVKLRAELETLRGY